MGDAGAGLGEAGDLAVRQVHGVGEDGLWPKSPGTVIHVGVVDRVGEKTMDLVDLVAILGDVRLPIRARCPGESG